MAKNKNIVIVDHQFIFDADEDVWSSSRDYEQAVSNVIREMGGEGKVLLKTVLSANYAKYITEVKGQTPKVETPKMPQGKKIPEMQKSLQTLKNKIK